MFCVLCQLFMLFVCFVDDEARFTLALKGGGGEGLICEDGK